MTRFPLISELAICGLYKFNFKVMLCNLWKIVLN